MSYSPILTVRLMGAVARTYTEFIALPVLTGTLAR